MTKRRDTIIPDGAFGYAHGDRDADTGKVARTFRQWMALDGWTLEGTGGGCEAYTKETASGPVFYLTRQDDPSAPESITEPCDVGLYNGHDDVSAGHVLDWTRARSVAQGMKWADEMTAALLDAAGPERDDRGPDAPQDEAE